MDARGPSWAYGASQCPCDCTGSSWALSLVLWEMAEIGLPEEGSSTIKALTQSEQVRWLG